MRQDGVDIVMEIAVICRNRGGAGKHRVDGELHVRVFTVYQLFARARKGIHHALQYLIGARSEGHARGIELVTLGERFGIDFRIKMARVDRLLRRLECRAAHAERGFVGRQLDRFVVAG